MKSLLAPLTILLIPVCPCLAQRPPAPPVPPAPVPGKLPAVPAKKAPAAVPRDGKKAPPADVKGKKGLEPSSSRKLAILKVEVVLTNGVKFAGYVRDTATVLALQAKKPYRRLDLWWVYNANGYMSFRPRVIAGVIVKKTLREKEFLLLKARVANASQIARTGTKETQDQLAELRKKHQEYLAGLVAARKTEAKTSADASKEKEEHVALLKKYPPDKWSEDRYQRIKRYLSAFLQTDFTDRSEEGKRGAIKSSRVSKTEYEFTKDYEKWRKAVALFKAGAITEKDLKGGTQPAAATDAKGKS